MTNGLNATIVVPVYNTEIYLPKCFESLCNQTRKDFNILVVDDNSNGPTGPVVESFRGAGLAIKHVRHEQNRGVFRARMTGFHQAEGDYIGFLDPDDRACPKFVERLLGTAEKTGADIVGCSRPAPVKTSTFTVEGAEALLKAYADRKICNYNVWTKFYRRGFVSDLGELKQLASARNFCNSEDLLINVLCALEHPTYSHIPDILVEYNEGRAGSLTNPTSSKTIRRSFSNAVLVYEIVHEVASCFRESIEEIVVRSAAYNYRKLLLVGDEEDMAWACEHLTKSRIGALLMSAMLQEAHRLKFDYAKQRKQILDLRARLATERERAALARQRRERLRPIVGDLYRWGRSIPRRLVKAVRFGDAVPTIK